MQADASGSSGDVLTGQAKEAVADLLAIAYDPDVDAEIRLRAQISLIDRGMRAIQDSLEGEF